MQWTLTLEVGNDLGRQWQVLSWPATVGRSEDNTVALVGEASVSRSHARLVEDAAGLWLEDQRSANGSFVNEQRVQNRAPVRSGDLVGFGSVRCRVEMVGEGQSTRIFSAPVADATRVGMIPSPPSVRPGSPESAATAAGAAEPPIVRRQFVWWGLGILGLAVAAWILSQARRSAEEADAEGGLTRCTVLDAAAPLHTGVFGNVAGTVCDAGDSLKVEVEHEQGSRIYVWAAPFRVSDGELELWVNGSKVAPFDASMSRWSPRQVIPVPDDKVNKGDTNTIELRHVRKDDWGVERLEIEQVAVAQADVRKGQEAFVRAQNLFRNRAVAARNLHDAWLEARAARRLMDTDPRPDDYRVVLETEREIEKELDKQCRERLFLAQQQGRYGGDARASELFRQLINAFPSDAHACRSRVEEVLPSIDTEGAASELTR